MRLHHRLVAIRCFANGNGRHARLVADVLVQQLGRPSFSWGASALADVGQTRSRYIEALQAADDGDYQSLLRFARS